MRTFTASAALLAVFAVYGCGSHDSTMASGIMPAGASRAIHPAAIPMPPKHFVIGAREYRFSTVVVDYENPYAQGPHDPRHITNGFVAPKRVIRSTDGVHVVDMGGRTHDFPPNARIQYGVGEHYLNPGQPLPSWLSSATYVRTIRTIDGG